MMTNLFSIFDPSISLFSLSWLIFFICLSFMPLKTWFVHFPSMFLFKKLVSIFSGEVSFTLGKKEKGVTLLIMSLFMVIVIINVVALYPQVFSVSSHVSLNFPMSLAFWLALMMFGWTSNTNKMLSHLVPQGTPNVLMMFMVLIELVSNIIRPITLCVRLTANLIAGHLLMSLLGNALVSSGLIILLFVPVLLTVLELAVSFIQAYVFMTLITLYTTEMK